MADPEKYQMIITTCPDLALAERIANELVVDNLAACVQIIPGVTSFFRWQDKVDRASEFLVLIKTVAENYLAVENHIKSSHSYEVPEIIAVPVVAGARDYLAWIDDNS